MAQTKLIKGYYKHRVFNLKITPKRNLLRLRFSIASDGKMFLRAGIYFIGKKKKSVTFIKPAPKSESFTSGFYMNKKGEIEVCNG